MNSTYAVDKERWAHLDILNQMGNIYSEVGRSFKTRGDADQTDHKAAIARALDLFNTTLEILKGDNSPRAREVEQARDQFLLLVRSNAAQESFDSLDRYFLQFAIAARNNR